MKEIKGIGEILSPRRVELPPRVLLLMEELERAGEEVYAVGGSLRDMLLGIEPHDFDLATSAPPERTAEIFSHRRVIETGMKHGTVTVLAEGDPIEITTFRIDGSYTDCRHPDSVTFTKRIEEDLSRRDFTVNAMAFNPRVGLVDPFGGREDLARRLLRAVGEPKRRFEEDALRIMRAFRFSAQLGFSIEEETLHATAETKEGLRGIAVERIAVELSKLILSPAPAEALRMMEESGALAYVLGEYCPDGRVRERLSEMPREEDARLGFLLSGLERTEAAALLRRLKYSNKRITGGSAVAYGVRVPLRDPGDARRLIAQTGAYAEASVRGSVLLGLSPEEAIGWVTENRGACSIADLAVSGRALCALGLRGKEIGQMLEYLLGEVIREPSLNEKETLLAIASHKIAENGKE